MATPSSFYFQVLHHPKLSFFHEYLVSVGAQLPPKPAAKATPNKEEVKPNMEAVKLTKKKAKQANKEEEERKEAKSARFKIKKQAKELARSSLAQAQIQDEQELLKVKTKKILDFFDDFTY